MSERKHEIALVITQSLNGPPSGGRMRLEATFEGLSRVGEVTVVEVGRGAHQPQDESSRQCFLQVNRQLPSRFRYAIWLAFGRLPPLFIGWKPQRDLDAVLGFSPDLVWFRPSVASRAVRVSAASAVVIDVDDLEGVKDSLIREARGLGSGIFRRTFDRFAGKKVRSTWERFYERCCDNDIALVACTTGDAAYMKSNHWVPNGYLIPARPAGQPLIDRAPPTFVFIGRLTYLPNVQAVDELLDTVWPAVRCEVPDARLVVVGAGSERWTSEAVDDSIEFVGEVSAVEPYLATATAVVMPIRSGGGTRLKALEAFAHCVPVVATAFAVQGLGVSEDVHYLRADSASDFARQARRLVESARERKSLTERSRTLVSERFSHEVSVAGFAAVAESCLGAATPASRDGR